MNYFQLADDAIEAVVLDTFPNSSGVWSTITPMATVNGWGLGLGGWATVVKRIEEKFNDAIRPLVISIPKQAIMNLGNRPMIDFQTYIADKALKAEETAGRRINVRAAAAEAASATSAPAKPQGAKQTKASKRSKSAKRASVGRKA